MNDNDRSLVTMCDVTDNILTINNPEWSVKAVFAAIVTVFRALRTRVGELLLITERDDTGITEEKLDSRTELIQKGYRICRALYTLAMNTVNKELKRRVDNSLSSLHEMDDEKLIDFMQILYGISDSYMSELEDYDILEAEITALDLAITDFISWKTDPTAATSQRTSANAELVVKIREMVDVLKTRMDPAMYLFENSGTSFYADFFNGRNIIQPGGADAQTQNGINPIETDTIINLPFTNLGAGKEVRIKCLTPGTNFEIYCSNAPSVPPTGTPLSINDVISPIHTTTDELGWLPDSPYINIHFPPLPVEIEWEVRVG